MALHSGQKKWTFFDPCHTNRLRPRYFDSFDPVFDIEASSSTLKSLSPFSLILKPGQILFVPAGCPHKVENLQTSIAVSGNIVNDTNVKEASVHLQRNALVDHRAGELLEEWLHRGLIKWQTASSFMSLDWKKNINVILSCVFSWYGHDQWDNDTTTHGLFYQYNFSYIFNRDLFSAHIYLFPQIGTTYSMHLRITFRKLVVWHIISLYPQQQQRTQNILWKAFFFCTRFYVNTVKWSIRGHSGGSRMAPMELDTSHDWQLCWQKRPSSLCPQDYYCSLHHTHTPIWLKQRASAAASHHLLKASLVCITKCNHTEVV